MTKVLASFGVAALLAGCQQHDASTGGDESSASGSESTPSTTGVDEPTTSTCSYGYRLSTGSGGTGGTAGSSSIGGGGAGGSSATPSSGGGGAGGSSATPTGGGGASGGSGPSSSGGAGGGCATPQPMTGCTAGNEPGWICVANEWMCDGCATAPEGECCEEPGWRCEYGTWACGPTPLVLVFDEGPVRYADAPLAAFDLSGLGASMATDWPTAATPWLALDRDGDGRIGAGDELFGSATRLASGERPANGFDALADLDADGDGLLTPNDPAFASLVLWADADADRVSQPRELAPLAARGVRWIELGYRGEPRCDARRNCEVERARFGYVDAAGRERTGAVVDLHLPARRTALGER